MDVDGGWDDYPPEDDRSSGNDAGDAMEVDAEVVREALRTLSAARGHAGNEDDPCLLYTSPSPRDLSTSRMPSSA